jgi:hypothetical protein
VLRSVARSYSRLVLILLILHQPKGVGHAKTIIVAITKVREIYGSDRVVKTKREGEGLLRPN